MELVLKRKFELLRPPFYFFLLSLFLASLFLCPDAESARKPVVVKMGGGEAVVTALQGTAKLALADGGWRLLKTGNTMKGGDQVVTGADSRLEITLPDRSCLRFAENTSFKIVQIDVNEEANRRTVRVNVALGKTWANVSKTFRVKPKVEVSCENAVAGVRGTIYRMNVNVDRSVLIRVYEGEVAVWGGGKATERPTTKAGPPEGVSGPVSVPGPQKVTMEEWVELVKAMQQITVSRRVSPESPVPSRKRRIVKTGWTGTGGETPRPSVRTKHRLRKPKAAFSTGLSRPGRAEKA